MICFVIFMLNQTVLELSDWASIYKLWQILENIPYNYGNMNMSSCYERGRLIF